MRQLKIAIAQLNPTVGDIAGNMRKILDTRAKFHDVDLVMFAECVLTGYPLEDLVLRPQFMTDVMKAIDTINTEVLKGGPAIVYGTPYTSDGAVYNAAVFAANGQPNGHNCRVVYKSELPNYDVFDEKRIFRQGIATDNTPIFFRDFNLGVMICEDTWFPRVTSNLYRGGADVILSLNGSPYQAGKNMVRQQVVRNRITECQYSLPIIYVNQIGGQDELVFDGGSFVMNREGSIIMQMRAFDEDVQIVTLTKPGHCVEISTTTNTQYPDELESVYRALMLGVRDYVEKNGFPGVVLGMSGGIDSGLVAAIAADAIGPDRVWAVRLPSQYTSSESNDLADEECKRLGVRCDTIAIGNMFTSVTSEVEKSVTDGIRNDELWRENTQASLRALVLRALSNRHGHMILGTSNRSEGLIGYFTWGGDNVAGFSPLLSVYKTTVFALSRWRNENHPIGSRLPNGPRQRIDVIPVEIINRPPTAELKEGQTDEASLMPYDKLDEMLRLLIDDEVSVQETAAQTGIQESEIQRFLGMVYNAEYKRRQCPPGVKIGNRSLGRGRRYPITSKWRGR